MIIDMIISNRHDYNIVEILCKALKYLSNDNDGLLGSNASQIINFMNKI